jgi:hypothetical protein
MVIVAMLVIGVLGAGIYSLTNSSTFTGLLSNKNDQAYQLAQAGVRYAIDNIFQSNPNYPSTDFFLPDNNHKFNITVANNVITSIGIVNAGTFLETQRQIIYNVLSSWDSGSGSGSPPSLPAPTQPVISLQNDAPSFTPTQSSAGSIAVSSTGTITLGGGVGNTNNSGTILYQGSSSISNCNAGACYFPCGLRAYFQFTANEDNSASSMNIGDGFTFGVFSAINNTRDRSGGAPYGNSVSMGELMGYAGPGNTTSAGTAATKDSLGLKPPKMAVEFDFYPNNGETSSGCGSGREDYLASPAAYTNNHMAIIFWGANPVASTQCAVNGTNYPQASFDDNVHGAGSGDTSTATSGPVNSGSPLVFTTGYVGSTGYYAGAATTCSTLTNPSTCNWMEDGHTYSFRLEISRDGTNDGLYQINGWITTISPPPNCSGSNCMSDVTTPFTASVPQITRTITLDSINDAALNQIYFGFTEATGSASQNVQVSNLGVFFPQLSGGVCTGNCTYAITPTSASFTPSAQTGQTVAVTAATGCTWTAVSDSTTWLTVTGGASGTSFGTVTYNVAADTGPARTGHIIIGGQTFTVTQANGCTYAISPTSASLASSAATGQTVAVTAGTGCTWTAVSNNPTWLTVTGGASGTGNGTVTYSATANTSTTAARTGTITIGGQTFTVTQAKLCSAYRVWNQTGATYDFLVTGNTCRQNITSGNEITTTTASTQLQAGGTVTRYTTAGGGCSSAVQGSISYTNAVNVDVDGDCQINYNSGDVAGDR